MQVVLCMTRVLCSWRKPFCARCGPFKCGQSTLEESSFVLNVGHSITLLCELALTCLRSDMQSLTRQFDTLTLLFNVMFCHFVSNAVPSKGMCHEKNEATRELASWRKRGRSMACISKKMRTLNGLHLGLSHSWTAIVWRGKRSPLDSLHFKWNVGPWVISVCIF